MLEWGTQADTVYAPGAAGPARFTLISARLMVARTAIMAKLVTFASVTSGKASGRTSTANENSTVARIGVCVREFILANRLGSHLSRLIP